MKTFAFILIGIFCSCFISSNSQNAPVTTTANIFAPGPSVTVPVTITGFTDIGSISLTMDYNTSIVTASGLTANVLLPGFTADWTTVPGRIVMSWIGLPGVTLPDNDTLVKITFSGLVGGEALLTWFDDGTSCEYSKYDGGAYNVLNDSPGGSYYINGLITHHRSAPVTIAPIYTSTPNTSICIPVKVVGFTNIGAISLTLDYNPAILTSFLSYNSSTIPLTWTWSIAATNPGRMIISGFGPVFSLPDTSILFNACFQYNGGTTLLAWYDADGSSCEYADEFLEPLYDLPQSTFYINGLVTETIYADFSADNLTPPRNTTVYFTDLSTGGPTSWNWSFSPDAVSFVNSTSATSPNPEVQFINGGLYTVTLTIHNAYTTDTETKTAYIRAGIHGLWIGKTSTEWLTSSNWDDDLTPINLSNVLITTSTSPTYWPKYTGSLVIGDDPGAQCKKITFEGSGYMMTVKGTMTSLSNLPESTVHAVSGTGNIIFELP
jgi:PKD repeat protein